MDSIPLSKIVVNPNNHRNKIDVEDLALSLSKQGQLEPIRIRIYPKDHSKYEVIFGNRRLEAARKLGWEKIDAVVVSATDYESLISALVENVDREDFLDYEKALLLKRIHEESGQSYAEIAGAIGKSRAFVSQHVAMLELFTDVQVPDDEKTRVLSGMSEKHARILWRTRNPNTRWANAKLCVSAGLSTRELERLTQNQSGSFDHATRGRRNEALEAIINEIVAGLNSYDVSPYFGAASSHHFTMFSQFPPFDKLDLSSAKDHMVTVLKKAGHFEAKIENMDVRVVGKLAYASLVLRHEIRVSEKTVRTRTRGTLIFERDKLWKIVHHHWSTADPSAILEIFSEKPITAK